MDLSPNVLCAYWNAAPIASWRVHPDQPGDAEQRPFQTKRLGYPELKRAVREQAEAFSPRTVLIEDKASGTQLIQELLSEGMHAIQKYEPSMDKTMRMHSVTSMIENGFVHLPDKAAWLPEYLHEVTSFPGGKYDDQADSTSQALDWFKSCNMNFREPFCEYLRLGDDGFDSSSTYRGALFRESNRTRVPSFARY